MKIRQTFSISQEALKRLEYLEKNGHNIYGKKCTKSSIVDTLILNTKDRLAMIKAKKQELAKEINFLTEEQDAIEKVRQLAPEPKSDIEPDLKKDMQENETS